MLNAILYFEIRDIPLFFPLSFLFFSVCASMSVWANAERQRMSLAFLEEILLLVFCER